MASVHTTVTFQAFNDLNTDGRRVIFCAHTQEGEGLIVLGTERHVCVFKMSTHKPGEDT